MHHNPNAVLAQFNGSQETKASRAYGKATREKPRQPHVVGGRSRPYSFDLENPQHVAFCKIYGILDKLTRTETKMPVKLSFTQVNEPKVVVDHLLYEKDMTIEILVAYKHLTH